MLDDGAKLWVKYFEDKIQIADFFYFALTPHNLILINLINLHNSSLYLIYKLSKVLYIYKFPNS